MLRLHAMLLLGTLTLVPAAAVADTFACKDAEGNWVLGNAGHVDQHRCVGKVQRDRGGRTSTATRSASSSSRGDVKAIRLAPREYQDHIRRAADKYQLSEALLHAVMRVESGYQPRALSVKGAQGLMQLMPGTAKDMHVRDVWSPEENIYGGARYLRILANQYQGDLVKTLAAYNAGPEAVKRARGVPEYQETKDYVKRVLEIYEELKGRNVRGDG